MLNESIVATGIHYLSCENITTSKLAFRMGLSVELDDAISYEQNDKEKIIDRSFGLQSDSPNNQPLGSIATRQGRIVVFPNLYQHRVDPFQLLDPTRPGRRTIVAFFLCDPTYRVLSTSDIAPQREDWLRQILFSTSKTPSGLVKLPNEIKDKILSILRDSEAILDRKGAEEVRAKLMTERSRHVRTQNEQYFEGEFK